MNHTSYIQNLFYSFIQDSSIVSEKIMFVKHFNTLNMSLEDIEKVVGESYKKGLLYHRYSRNDIKEPYEPLINGIRYYYQKLLSTELSVEDFVEQCDIYPLHKEIMVSYLKTGHAKRTEPIVTAEAVFETTKFIESVIKCLDFISRKTSLLIILDRFQLAPYSLMNVIVKMLNDRISGDIKLLIIYNELQSPPQYVEEIFGNVIRIAEEKNVLFEWESNEELVNSDFHSSFIPNKRFFREYIDKLYNLYHMLAIRDAEHFITSINNRIIDEKINIDRKDKFDFFAISALCNIIEGDNNNALLICERMHVLFDENTDYQQAYTYYRIFSMAQIGMYQRDASYNSALKCIEFGKKLEDEYLEFIGEILKESAQFIGWGNIFAVDYEKIVVNKEFEKKLEENKFYNTLAYYTLFAYDNDLDSIREIVQGKESEHYKKVVQIGNMLKNTNFLLDVYTKNTVMFSDRGYLKYTDRFYNEKLKILQEDNNTIREAHMYLGMGYNAIISEQYTKANDYFNRAIEVLYRLKNAEGIIEALYNMSVNCISAQDYLSACDYLNTIFEMLNNLELESIQICTATKLYAMLALSYYMIGNDYRCYKCESNMENQIGNLITEEVDEMIDSVHWHEDLFHFYFLNSLLSKNNGNYTEAAEYLDKSYQHFVKYPSVLFYMIVNIIGESYDLYEKLGDTEKTAKIFDYGIKYCEQNGYVGKTKQIMQYIEKKGITTRPITADFSTISLKQMIDLSYKVGMDFQLKNRKKDIRFLSSLQEVFNRDEIDEQNMINNTMLVLKSNFGFDTLVFISFSEKNGEIKYSDSVYVDDIDFKVIFEYFKSYKREFLSNRKDKTFNEYEKIINMFGGKRVISIIGVPIILESGLKLAFIASANINKNFRNNRNLYTNDDLVIIKTAIIQLDNSLERIRSKKNIIEMNDRLNALAITDMLTGLYNRQGFAKKIEENSNNKNSVSILYADLDNFKYYNDTFGHDVGDLILVEFARVFREVSEKNGYAVRYGGDEFLVVLNNVSDEKIRKVVEQIYESIADGFEDAVSEYKNKKVNIPMEKRVSCSIGIASSNNATGETIKETLQRADEALYYMKKNHKGSYILWDEING